MSSVATLLAGVGSTPDPGMATPAAFDNVPVNVGAIVASTTNVAVAPLWRSTTEAMLTVPDAVSHVAEADAVHVHVIDVSSAGITSVTGASAIVEGPRLVTMMEYWMAVPATAVRLPSVFVIDRSA